MSRLLLWSISGLLVAALTALAACPASWMTARVESMTAGRLTLGDPQGTLWRGSALIAGSPGRNEALTALLPGRFSWRLSPMVLLGQVDAQVENASALSGPVHVTGTWSRWQLTPASVVFGAQRLTALGAPLNTIRPEGEVRLSWGPLAVERDAARMLVNGTITLGIDELSSRLSPIKPLGAYRLTMRCEGADARIVLETLRGPMLLSGSGGWIDGRWRFSGRAEAAPGSEEALANFLNLLGESRREGTKEVIALEFQ